MISDKDLYSLAVFLGVLSMLLIVLYHFLEVNSEDATTPAPQPAEKRTSATKGSSEKGKTTATKS